MARLDTKLNIKTGKGGMYDMAMSDNYTEVYQNINKVDNSDTFITLATLAKTNVSLLKGSKLIVIKNNSSVGVEIQLGINEFNDSSNVDQYTEDLYITQILGANEFMVLPNQYMLAYATDTSGGMAKTINNQGGYDVATSLETDSTADVDVATDGAIASGTTTTTLYLEPYTSAANCTANLFRVGDLIRLENEICEVTAIGDKSDLANNYLTIRRGLFGSTAATHADDVSVDLPFFNTQSDYDAYTYSQTNASGKFTSQNLFGYGRSLTYPAGIVKGSFAMKFYKPGYQEMSLSGVTGSSNSGLTASTTYQFTIAVDGGSAYDLSFTTDATDLSVRKVLNLIQTQMDTAYYASSGNLKNKRVSVALVNGDIRFTSGQRTRASAIALGDSSSGGTDLWSAGIFPAVASCETAVPALLPDDTILSRDTYIESSNINVFSYDNGNGNIVGGEANGTINYETGALDIIGPANAEFVVSFNYDSAHSGGVKDTSNQENGITQISARSINSKIDAEVEILGFV
tara:strand:+ start:823 stop:2373 length:1551 start_codon:yes stop_codon:yes gene_type:complete